VVGQIGMDNPAKNFKKLIDDEENEWKPGNFVPNHELRLVFKEMEKVIRDVVADSFADTSYDKAIEALRAYRSGAIEVNLLWRRLM